MVSVALYSVALAILVFSMLLNVLGRFAGAAILGFSLGPTMPLRQRFPLPAGQYYLAIDNSARVGATNPPFSPLGVLGQNTAVISYAVELGDADDDF